MRPREAIRKLDQVIDIVQDDIEECKKMNDQNNFDLYSEALECVKLSKKLLTETIREKEKSN